MPKLKLAGIRGVRPPEEVSPFARGIARFKRNKPRRSNENER